MIGGYYKKLATATTDVQRIEAENASIKGEIKKLEGQLENLKSLQETESEEVTKLVTEKEKGEEEIEKLRLARKQLFEERLILQNEISKQKIEKAKIEAILDNLKLEFAEFSDVKEMIKSSIQELQDNVRKYIVEINSLGPVNMRAIEEFKTINVEFEEMKKKLDRLLEEKAAVIKIVHEVEKKRYDKFMETLNKISENFSNIYKDLMNGTGRLRLEIENDIDSGLIIEASPAGKNIVNLDTMSGGEKTLTSLAFLFAILQLYYSPFYILDEVDAALDKANTKKIVDVVKKYSRTNQFIVITHNDFTIQEADKVFGVSMEDGVSKVFGIELPKE
jgi:chromosome segregation protein